MEAVHLQSWDKIDIIISENLHVIAVSMNYYQI